MKITTETDTNMNPKTKAPDVNKIPLRVLTYSNNLTKN